MEEERLAENVDIKDAGLDLRKLKKNVEVIEKYIDSYQKTKGVMPPRIVLYRRDWEKIGKALKEKGVSLSGCTYRGVPIEKET